jgi:hypothetical protein
MPAVFDLYYLFFRAYAQAQFLVQVRVSVRVKELAAVQDMV